MYTNVSYNNITARTNGIQIGWGHSNLFKENTIGSQGGDAIGVAIYISGGTAHTENNTFLNNNLSNYKILRTKFKIMFSTFLCFS